MNQVNFNSIAFIYDFLARLVFGGSILNAQRCYLTTIPDHSRVLILGGGTGVILDELEQLSLSLKVTYVEPSSAMMKRAQSRASFKHIKVKYVQARHDAVLNMEPFDVVITNFFLDIFRKEQLPAVISDISAILKAHGIWLVTDFAITDKKWQQTLIRLMYWFFRVTTRLEGNQLLDFKTYLKSIKFVATKERHFYDGMISSAVYERKSYACLPI